jgi:D-glycero-alpha-D-manno-heptose-7-phosphate kinase
MGKIIQGKSPLRISFAGGGTDLNYIFETFGGAVVSSTIDKFCHMTIEERSDKEFWINGKPITEHEILAYKVIEYFKPKKGFNLYYYNDIPVGSGLGSSSSFVVLMLRLLYELHDKVPIDYDLVKEAWVIENKIKECGFQDQYATAIGGFNFMEFSGEKTVVYPLRLKYSFIQQLNEYFVLVYVGGNKENRDLHKELRKYSEKNIKELNKTSFIKDLAYQMRDCLLNSNTDNIGKILKENWKLKRNKYTTNKKIDNIYDIGICNGAEGGKLCGSGQAGHFLFFVKPKNRQKLIKALERYKIVDFNFSIHGTETWRIK